MYKGFIKDVMNARDITSLNIVEPLGVALGNDCLLMNCNIVFYFKMSITNMYKSRW